MDDTPNFLGGLWACCWTRAVILLVGAAVFFKLFMPLRCRTCGARTVQQQDEVSARTMKRCLRCGLIEDIGDGADD